MEEELGEELVREFLGDMPAVRFIYLYILAFVGMIIFFATDVSKAIKYDKSTANKFNWRDLFRKGGLRLFINVLFIAAGILFYGDISVHLMNSEVPLVIDGWAALLLGINADLYVTKFLGLRRNGK